MHHSFEGCEHASIQIIDLTFHNGSTCHIQPIAPVDRDNFLGLLHKFYDDAGSSWVLHNILSHQHQWRDTLNPYNALNGLTFRKGCLWSRAAFELDHILLFALYFSPIVPILRL